MGCHDGLIKMSCLKFNFQCGMNEGMNGLGVLIQAKMGHGKLLIIVS